MSLISGHMNLLSLRQLSSSALSSCAKSWKRTKGKRRFVDFKRVRVCGGKGGDGLVSFKCPTSTRVLLGGPDGGDGGNGGSVVFLADASVKSMCSLLSHYKARDGADGQGSYRQGSNGKDVVIKVPPGTLIRDDLSPTKDILHDLLTPGSSCSVAEGGEGGLGNARFSSTADRKPTDSTLGAPGEEHVVGVELRTIADVGLVGFPNAGKSTLLRALSHAKPKVGNYPFTTVHPEIGVMEVEGKEGGEDSEGERTQVTVADIPGLVPGAHLNKGLGHSFLKHVQRCSILLLVLDASCPQASMATQLQHLEQEMQLYDSQLLDSTHFIVANKMDAHGDCGMEECGTDHQSANWSGRDKEGTWTLCSSNAKDLFEKDLQKLQSDSGLPVIPVSALLQWNIKPLKEAILRACN